MAGQGTKILASDYNVVQSAISTVLGTGSGTKGYGQSVSSSQLVGNPAITVAQWNNLRNDLLKAYLHQGSPGILTIPNAPSTATKVNAADYSNYLSLSSAITTNSNVVPPAGQASLTTLSAGTRTTAWNGTVTHTVTLTFASADTARYFFNSGSRIQFSGSLTGYANDGSLAKNDDWATILSNMGTISMNWNSTTTTGTFSSIASAVGFYQLTTTPTSIFSKATASPTYTPNKYEIFASVDANTSPRIITFTIRFQDLSAPGGFSIDENVSGTLASLVQTYYATGSNVAVSLPSVTSSGP